jgi:alkanesulfonate monooxygenase SsuD/methylene tetrahydromethanopterin reductase-like flavin-dependent oxidoreductase (luciferase family)
MVAVNVFAADTDREAERISTSQQQSFINLLRGTPAKIQPPVDNMDTIWTPAEKLMVEQRLGGSITGGPEKVRRELRSFLDYTKADELIVHAMIYDHDARLRSYAIVADAIREGAADAAGK